MRGGRVSVSKVGGKSGKLVGCANAPTNSYPRTVMDHDLTPQQEAEARRIFDALKQTTDADLLALARLLAAKPDGELLGATEFQVRDRALRLGAKALEAALDGRKKGGTKALAAPARTARRRPSSRGGKAGPS
jgi:hypothetical protein